MQTTDTRTRMAWARGRWATGALVLWALTLVISVGITGAAKAATFATSNSPYWKVGSYSDQLTKACRRGQFNQIKVNTYNIHYLGQEGRSVTGIATKGWNLKDPRGLAPDGFTFHFFNDGYSNCRVYIAKPRLGDD